MTPSRSSRARPVITRSPRGMSRRSSQDSVHRRRGRGSGTGSVNTTKTQLSTAGRPERPPVDAKEIDSELVRRPGPVSTHLGPVRTCVGCRSRTSAADLLRVVVVAGALVPDPRRRLPGRGAWLHQSLSCLRTAERRRAFPRALRANGMLNVDQLVDHLEQLTGEQYAGGSTPGRHEEGSRSTRHESAVKLKP
ncbi:MAG TPA: YlxR family protein [Pseudonocardiaceae bacterium]|nr:YlxR family protein [Pseudonocardiaceae bacterium]